MVIPGVCGRKCSCVVEASRDLRGRVRIHQRAALLGRGEGWLRIAIAACVIEGDMCGCVARLKSQPPTAPGTCPCFTSPLLPVHDSNDAGLSVRSERGAREEKLKNRKRLDYYQVCASESHQIASPIRGQNTARKRTTISWTGHYGVAEPVCALNPATK
jgi:hypothetical protein